MTVKTARGAGRAARATALALFGAIASVASVPIASADEAAPREAFRVCADANYMPFSNDAGEGLENRVAEILAGKLGLPVTYEWFPQRMGFIRNTLRREDVAGEHVCDVVIGVPDGFELAITTKPWYRSTYAMVFVEGRGLDDVKSAEDLVNLPDARRSKLRFGLAERNPGTVWLARHGMLDLIEKAYASQLGDPGVEPNGLEKQDLLAGDIDVTMMWGPIAGYFAKQHDNVRVVPLESEPGARFHFAIAMGVRFADKAWRAELQQLLDDSRDEIAALLAEFQVPLVDEDGNLL